MRRAWCTVSILVLICYSASAQIPGDFNCNGEANGIDVTRYWAEVNCCIFDPIDTAGCFWQNGDVNNDDIYCTLADFKQLHWRLLNFRPGDNLPLLPEYDSLIIGNGRGNPGGFVYLPIYIRVMENMAAFQINSRFSDQYLRNATVIAAPGFVLDRMQCDTSVVIFSDSHDSLLTGRYWIGNIRFEITEDAPPNGTLNVDVVESCYFPTGFVNYSYPTYFISPRVVSGEVWINPDAIDETPTPDEFELNIYPNPFNAQTAIVFQLARTGWVSIKIYDYSGRLITDMWNDTLSAGKHVIRWDASEFVSGIYICKLETSDGAKTRQMTLIK